NKKYELGQSNNGIRREMDISQVDENIRIVARLISDEKNYDFIPDFLYGQLSEEENEENQTKISADRARLHFNEIHIEDSVPLHISTILGHLQQLLKTESSVDHIQTIAKETYQLFQLWTTLSQEKKQQLFKDSGLDSRLQEEAEILRELISFFEKRYTFVKQEKYEINPSIKQDDVMK